jgi:hypothetical protein
LKTDQNGASLEGQNSGSSEGRQRTEGHDPFLTGLEEPPSMGGFSIDLYLIEHCGEDLFRLACQHDIEGIVAKPKHNPYLQDHAGWLKIRNREYSQWVGGEDLFDLERESVPEISYESLNCCCSNVHASLERVRTENMVQGCSGSRIELNCDALEV